ncbi:MAG: hypothetical protein ACTHK7_11515 [Aureliella sp.]
MEAVATQKRATRDAIEKLRPRIKQLFEEGFTRQQISRELGISLKIVRRVVGVPHKSFAFLSQHPGMRFDWLPENDEAQFTTEHVPTQEEILRETLKFQLEWSKAETMRRQGGHLGDY